MIAKLQSRQLMKYDKDALTKELELGLKKAVADAIKRHKLLGQSIAVWVDGKVVVVSPEEIKLPENKKNNNNK